MCSAMYEPGLDTAWSVLSTEKAHQETVQMLPVGPTISAGPILAGLDYQGRRSLMVPLLPGEAFAEDRSGRAVHLERAAHQGKQYLVAKCLDAGLNDVFSVFAEELLDQLSPTSAASETVLDTLSNWRMLFSTAVEQVPLTASQQIGLLAELLVLAKIATIDPVLALESWTGPEASQHDFRHGTQAIEVKASRSREGRRHSISSVHQLDAPTGWQLTLESFKFERREDGATIGETVDILVSLGVSKIGLDKKLISCGINPQELPSYAYRWATLEDRLYDVGDPAFPKIIPLSFASKSVPPGTFNLSYMIDISNEPPLPLAENDCQDVYGRIAGVA